MSTTCYTIACVEEFLNCNYLLLVSKHKQRWVRLTQRSKQPCVCFSYHVYKCTHTQWTQVVSTQVDCFGLKQHFIYFVRNRMTQEGILSSPFFFFNFGEVCLGPICVWFSVRVEQHPNCLVALPQKQQTCVHSNYTPIFHISEVTSWTVTLQP